MDRIEGARWLFCPVEQLRMETGTGGEKWGVSVRAMLPAQKAHKGTEQTEPSRPVPTDYTPAAGAGSLLPAMNHTFDCSPQPADSPEPAAGPCLIVGQPPLFQLWKDSSPSEKALE